MYHRLGHVNQIFVKPGDKVKKGQKIATNGTGNGQWLSHLHYDIFKEKQTNWTRYNIGWSKENTLNVWQDPTPYIKTVMPNFDHFGWRWLEYATYSGGKCYHPGADLNGPGAGNADYDDPLYSPVDGVIEHVYSGNASNGGWGRLIIIKEQMSEKTYHIDSKLVKVHRTLDEDFDGDKEKDHEKMAEKLEDFFKTYNKQTLQAATADGIEKGYKTKQSECNEHVGKLSTAHQKAISDLIEEQIKYLEKLRDGKAYFWNEKEMKFKEYQDVDLWEMSVKQLIGQIVTIVRKSLTNS